MPKPEPDHRPDKNYMEDLRSRFGDTTEQFKSTRWAEIKDRLAIIAVVLVLAFLVFMMFDGSITNFRCTFAEFVTFECNRWAGEEHPSLRRD
jgi:hypothetical protein